MSDQEVTVQSRRPRRMRGSSPSPIIWWPFFGRDWIASTRGMTPDQRGRWIDVLALLYDSPTPGVTSEDEVRAWSGYGSGEWPVHRARFLAFFKARRDGRWIQDRVKREAEAIKRRRKSASASGKKGADKRWGGREMNGDPIAEANGGEVASHSHSHKKNEPVPVGSLVARDPVSPTARLGPQPISAVLGEVLARISASGKAGT